MACIVTFHESWEMEEVVKQTNGVVKQHGVRTSMIGKVANCTHAKGETGLPLLSRCLVREDSWKTWTENGFDRT